MDVFGPDAHGLVMDAKAKSNFTPLILAVAGGAFMGVSNKQCACKPQRAQARCVIL